MSENVQQIWQWFSGSPLRILLVIAGALFTQYFGGRAIDRAMTRLASADLIPGPTNTVARQKERAHQYHGNSLFQDPHTVSLFILIAILYYADHSTSTAGFIIVYALTGIAFRILFSIYPKRVIGAIEVSTMLLI